MIVKSGDKWIVKSKDGTKELGAYDSEEEAKKRLAQIESFKAIKQVNIINTINSKNNISKQFINGKEHYVVKNVVPIIDNIVMNHILYKSDEIDKSYESMNNKFMPYNHPKIGSMYVSSSEPLAVNAFYIGAWAENASKSGDKVLVDMKVDVEFASRTDGGKDIISRLDALMNNANAEPIEISTGLFHHPVKLSGNSKGKEYNRIATDIKFDHIAILPKGIAGAGRPSDGVGIFSANGEEIEREIVYLNSAAKNDESTNKIKHGFISKIFNLLTNNDLSFDDVSNQMRSKLREVYTGDNWPYILQVYNDRFGYEVNENVYIQRYHIENKNVVQFDGEPVAGVIKTELEEIETNNEVLEMNEEQYKALLGDALKPVTEQLTAVNAENKALKDELAQIKKAITANADKEIGEMREAIKTKLGLSDVVVNSLTGDALSEMYSKTQSATGLNAGIATTNSNDSQWDNYNPNENIEGTK
jgi:hypothetical protein